MSILKYSTALQGIKQKIYNLIEEISLHFARLADILFPNQRILAGLQVATGICPATIPKVRDYSICLAIVKSAHVLEIAQSEGRSSPI
ncbi:MAG: hypothetical protein P8Y68_16440 [Anaerolineales bacterium]